MKKDKIALVCQRYGLEVNGGSELYCRQLAEKLTSVYDVEVFTTCAVDYVTWKNEYTPGTETIHGVTVHRFPSERQRSKTAFDSISQRVLTRPDHTDAEEMEWIEQQGPFCPMLLKDLANQHLEYKAVIFMTYLYYLTAMGLPMGFENAVLIPTVHDEPPVYLRYYESVFGAAKGFIWNTPEEKAFAVKRFPGIRNTPGIMAGVGVDIPAGELPELPENIRNCSYIIYAGRIDESKGCGEMFQFFQRYKQQYGGPLKLVLMGKAVMEVPDHPDIVPLGFVSDEMKFSVMASAKALVLFSQFESLSMVVLESMIMGRPVLVNGKSKVLKGHCIRSNAGLYFTSYPEFAGALNYLLEHPAQYEAMRKKAVEYVNRNYNWGRITEEICGLVNAMNGKENKSGEEKDCAMKAYMRKVDDCQNPPINLQKGLALSQFWDYLSDVTLEDANEAVDKELKNYLKEDFKRFCYTFSLLPEIDRRKKLLEIGGNPYYLTMLMKKYTEYEVTCTNCFNDDDTRYYESHQTVLRRSALSEEGEQIPWVNLNIEKNYLEEKQYDIICFCEVIEHMVESPIRALLNINSMMKNDGILIMSTPNVNRLENVARMIAGANLYDPYSGYGKYGRHNREYNKHELAQMLSLCGFEIETMFSANVHTEYAPNYFSVDKIAKLLANIPNRELDLGQYIFIRAKKVRDVDSVMAPEWLYRSLADKHISRGEKSKRSWCFKQ